jgi:hypothetical protein
MFVVFVGVGLRNATMGTVLLATPSGAYLDFSIGGICAVADDEVIAQFVHTSISVGSIKSPSSAGVGGAVVNDDVLPSI